MNPLADVLGGELAEAREVAASYEPPVWDPDISMERVRALGHLCGVIRCVAVLQHAAGRYATLDEAIEALTCEDEEAQQ
ncbi:hypothetical protein [Salininema proteolyticum]|uniref:Uncharacterized protein n=1 Tax=Salininema proteolyticum TaxID=1607685 RepID=A0ABV8TT05_9ACTN